MIQSKHKLIRMLVGAMALAALTLGSVIPLAAQTKHRRRTPVRRPVYYTLRAGKTIRVRMDETLSSKTARVGETFTTTVVEPAYAANGEIVIPEGSVITGRVISVVRAQKKGKPGSMDVSFRSLKLPNGLTRAINGSLTQLNDEGTTSDNEGGATGGSIKHRHAVFIGGGAGAGLIIGALAGGGRGAGAGILLGGGAGAAADYFLKGKEAEVKTGTQFGVILNIPLALPAFKSNV